MLTISVQYFPLLQQCSSYFLLPFGPYSCLPSLSLLPVSAFSYWRLVLASLIWLLLTTFIQAPFCSSRTLVPILSTWFPLLASPALQGPCSRAWSSSCHGPRICYWPEAFLTWVSETNCDLSNLWTHSTIHLGIFCWAHPCGGFTCISAYPNYREQQAEIPDCIVRAETPHHVYETSQTWVPPQSYISSQKGWSKTAREAAETEAEDAALYQQKTW